MSSTESKFVTGLKSNKDGWKMEAYDKLQGLLDGPAAKYSDRLAIRAGHDEVTFGELQDSIERLATGLVGLGLQPRDRVAWFMPNCMEAVLTTIACYRIGAISVPLNYRYLADEACYVMQQTQPALFLYHDDHVDVAIDLLSKIDPLPVYSVADGDQSNARHPRFSNLLVDKRTTKRVDVSANHPALILYTSGSTGQPKGVVHSHAGAYSGIDISRRIFDINEHSRVLVGKPISHAGGLETQLMPTLLAGGEATVTMKPTPKRAAALIQQYQITEYAMLASDLLDFIEYLEQNPTDLSSLKTSIGSGDSVPEDLHHRFRDLFGWEVMEACGMTEVGGYYAANPISGVRKWGSLGLPAPDTTLRIVDESGNDVRGDAVGEVLVQSPSATTGYWHNQEATDELFRDGWLHTGDLAHFDEDGYVWFVGRKKLMIVRRGSNIAPAEIENVLDAHPQVHASVVVGVPDRLDGHVPVACVSAVDPEQPPGEVELRAFVSQHLAEYKNPTRYLFIDELPRNSTGKFHRRQLETMAIEALRETDGA